MSYLDRLSKASYEAPSGSVHEFSYEVLSRRIKHRIGTFEFPGIDGTSHQDKGVSGEVYPLNCIFHGTDYDIEADAFVEALKERGNGFLNNPRWGKRRVQIISIGQFEDLVEEVGQARLEVQFQESLEKEFPETEASAAFAVEQDADTFENNMLDYYEDSLNAESLEDKNSLKQRMLAATETVNATLKDLTSSNDETASIFKGYISDIETNIDEYVEAPRGFINSIIKAIRLPSTIEGKIDSKLLSYTNLSNTLNLRSIVETNNATKNNLLIDEMLGSSSNVAVAESINTAIINSSNILRNDKGKSIINVPAATVGFRTRSESLAAAVYLRDSFGSLVDILDVGQVAFENKVLADSYIQAIQNYGDAAEVVTKVIKAALDLSFTLPTERMFTLQTSSTVMNQCYDLYNNVDEETIDYFILTNELNGEEILLLPKGKQIIYYA